MIGLGVELRRGGIFAKIGEEPAGFEEVLVAGGALLAVPALFVDQDDGGQQAKPLDGEGDVGQVGDGAVAVLKIEGVEELLGALGADFGQRLAHGERGAGVLGHGVGEDFGVGAVDGEDFGLVAGAGGQERFTGHEHGLANRIRHRGVTAGVRHLEPVGASIVLLARSVNSGNRGATGAMQEYLVRTSHKPRPLPPGRWAMTQRWNDLLFAHWPIPASRIAPLLPEWLAGRHISGVGMAGSGALLAGPHQDSRGAADSRGAQLSRPESCGPMCATSDTGTPGVYCFSLDSSNLLAVAAARAVLPPALLLGGDAAGAALGAGVRVLQPAGGLPASR